MKYTMIVVMVLTTTSCAGSYWSGAQMAQSNAYTYQPRTLLAEIFFEQTKPTRPYTQIGMIEAEGEEFTSNDELVRMLRCRARDVGGDAVIDVKKTTVEREDISIFDLFSDEEPDKYIAPLMTGIAVRYTD